ncbi:MAG: chloride channel protein [Bacteroidales bacterium]|jgi:CIC family chloride channel protein|nr:chloride channel protein [Bacteroidales bacterium]
MSKGTSEEGNKKRINLKRIRKLLRNDNLVTNRNFILLLSFVVGLLSGLSAVLMKNLVYFFHRFISENLQISGTSLLYFTLPLAGIFFTFVFVRYFVKDSISHGVTKVLHAISRGEANLPFHNTWSSMIAGSITVGFGGSVGMEAPIVMTGSAIGSNLGRLLKTNYRTTVLLLGCGAAGAIAGIFKAPIAAVVFVLEVLMFDLTLSSIIPLLISSVTAATVAYFLLGQGVEFSFTISDPFVLRNIPFYLLLGVFTGFVSLYFSKSAFRAESLIHRIRNPWLRLVSGGLLVGTMIYLFPPLFGEGYSSLRHVLGGDPFQLAEHSMFYPFRNEFWVFAGYLLLILLLKVYAMAFTNGSGGVGGLFAPSLFVGGIAGYFLVFVLHYLGFGEISSRNFALAGMAGVMSGVMHAPLTAIFLIAEITGGYQLFIPLIITSTLSFLTIRSFEPHSIYHRRLAEEGDLITHHKDKAVLTMMNLKNLIETDFVAVRPEMRLGDLVKMVSASKRNIFPVTDEEGYLLGIVMLDDIRHIMFDKDMYNMISVENIMHVPPAYVYLNERMESIVSKFEESRSWNLPVVEKGKYMGFISRARVFSAYRDVMKEFSEE